MAQRISQLPIGSKVKFLTFLKTPVEWRVIGNNLPKMPENSVTLFMDKIVALRCFDAREPDIYKGETESNGFDRDGCSDWGISNLRQWANSDAAAGKWYSAQSSTDNPPNKTYTGVHPYQDDSGFLYESTAAEKALLMSTTRYYGAFRRNSTSSVDRIFLLSTNEVGLESISNNGEKISYFEEAEDRLGYPTAACVADSGYSSKDFSAQKTWYYWLITSYAGWSDYVRVVGLSGEMLNRGPDFTPWPLYGDNANNGSVGVRFACNIPADTFVTDDADEFGYYSVVFNQPPTAPGIITLPDVITSTVPARIEWTASTDPEGELSGYILERKTDTQDFGEIYRGSAREYIDTLVKGTLTVQYRVKAYDSGGESSGWTFSEQRDVNNNQPPKISVGRIDNTTPSDTSPALRYTVTDEDSETVSVTEYIDDIVIKAYKADLGQTKTLKLDADKWVEILNGSHVYRIVAADDLGGQTEVSVEFVKTVDRIELLLDEPLVADERPSLMSVNISGAFPDGCLLKIEVCNNGFDAEPTWVDVTQQVQNSSRIYLENDQKTAEKWGIGIRASLERNGAAGECYLSSINGNYL